MPIIVNQPGPESIGMSRSGDLPTIGASAPPVDLLPSGGARSPGPAPAPHRALALDALRVLRTLRDRPRDAGSWGEPAFAREVDLVRSQLVPIRDRRGLAASFGREAFRSAAPGPQDRLPASPSRAAYAIRWLELGDGIRRPAWSEFVADPV
jgi:hypothetical protein